MGKVISFVLLIAMLLPHWATGENQSSETVKEKLDTSVQEKVEQLYNQAVQYHNTGEFEKAIEYYTKVIELNPEHAGAYWNRAEIYGQQEQYALAISDLSKVNLLAPDFPSAYGNLGWFLILQGKFDEARKPCQKAYELEPKNFAWAVNLGHTYLLTGDNTKARQYYEKTLKLLESEEQFQEGPVADFELFIKKGWQVEASRQELEWMKGEFKKIDPHYFEANKYRSEAERLYENGKYLESAQMYEKSIEAEKTASRPRQLDLATDLNRAGLCYYSF